MLSNLIRTHSFNLEYVKALVVDIPDEKLAVQPAPGMNHGAWILGHLAGGEGFLCQMVGDQFEWPAEWETMFGMKSVPVADRARYPDKATLIAHLDDAFTRAKAGLEKLKPEQLADPMPKEEVRKYWPTLGDGVLFFIATHDPMHIGQLSAWRRAMGFSRVRPSP